jgi:hypothetical protein
MRLLKFEINGMLGLKGSIDFTGGPVLLYGKNIAGKSNVVNLLRYLLTKPKGGRKKYREDLRLSGGELLLGENKGSCCLYLSQEKEVYKILLQAERRGKKKTVIYSISSTSSGDSFPLTAEALAGMEWKVKEGGLGDKISEHLEELKFFPDLLETLISPSNVKNFEEAVSGDLISVPEMIQRELSQIHAGAENYLDTLAGLEIVLSSEKERVSKRMNELKTEFSKLALKIGIDPAVFEKGATALGMLVQEVSKIREQLSEKKIRLGSKELEAKIEAYRKAAEIAERRQEIESHYKKFTEMRKMADELKGLRDFLVDISSRRVEDIVSAKIPSYVPERAKDLVEKVKEAIKRVDSAEQICKSCGITPEDIKRLLPSYRELYNSIRNPLRGVSGVSAIVFRSGEKSVVSIPVDEAEKNPEVFVELEPLPKIHIGEKFSTSALESVERRIKDTLSKLREAEDSMTEAGRLIREAKKRAEVLRTEAETAEQRAESLKGHLEEVMRELAEVSGRLRIFGQQLEVPKNIENLSDFWKGLNQSLHKIEGILREELEGIPLTSVTSVQEMLEAIQREKRDIEERVEACRQLESWLVGNLAEIDRLESRRKTIELLEEATLVSKEILNAVYRTTDINIIVENLSTHISKEVQAALQAVLPESSVEFAHVGGGLFECRIGGEKITHPSGLERACISIGVMLSLAKNFEVPVIFDEALDRVDADNVVPFLDYLTQVGQSVQITIAACKSRNIEGNAKLRDILSKWRIYRISVKGKEKIIEPVDVDSIIQSA